MIPVDLSANREGWIYDPNGSGIQILGISSRDPFSGSMDMSALHICKWVRPGARRVNWVQLHPLQVLLHSLALGVAPFVLKV